MPANETDQSFENIMNFLKMIDDVYAAGSRISQRHENNIKTNTYKETRQAGTGLANIDIPIGCAAYLRKTAISGHGGARNTAERTSNCLTLAQCRTLTASTIKAKHAGRPFNRHITIHWEAADIADNRAMSATTAFLKALREWATYPKLADAVKTGTANIWVRENGGGKGSHVHILAHIPAGKRWQGAIARRWLARISGKPYRRGWILTRRITGAGEPDGTLYAANLSTVLAYVLKGVEPDVAAALGIAHEPGGRIIGKRCGISRNIGGTAQWIDRAITLK